MAIDKIARSSCIFFYCYIRRHILQGCFSKMSGDQRARLVPACLRRDVSDRTQPRFRHVYDRMSRESQNFVRIEVAHASLWELRRRSPLGGVAYAEITN